MALFDGDLRYQYPMTGEEAEADADAINSVRALFPQQEDLLADIREPERRASNRRQKPYGTRDPNHELHRLVHDIFSGRP